MNRNKPCIECRYLQLSDPKVEEDYCSELIGYCAFRKNERVKVGVQNVFYPKPYNECGFFKADIPFVIQDLANYLKYAK